VNSCHGPHTEQPGERSARPSLPPPLPPPPPPSPPPPPPLSILHPTVSSSIHACLRHDGSLPSTAVCERERELIMDTRRALARWSCHFLRCVTAGGWMLHHFGQPLTLTPRLPGSRRLYRCFHLTRPLTVKASGFYFFIYSNAIVIQILSEIVLPRQTRADLMN